MLLGGSGQLKRFFFMEEEGEDYDVMEDIQKSFNIDNFYIFRYQFFLTYYIGVIKRDQYRKMKLMES